MWCFICRHNVNIFELLVKIIGIWGGFEASAGVSTWGDTFTRCHHRYSALIRLIEAYICDRLRREGRVSYNVNCLKIQRKKRCKMETTSSFASAALWRVAEGVVSAAESSCCHGNEGTRATVLVFIDKDDRSALNTALKSIKIHDLKHQF